MKKPLTIIHLISGLGQGGAETVLTRLITHSTYQHCVVSFSDEGVYGEVLKKAGIPVYTLNMQAGKFRLSDFKRLVALLKTLEGDLIQTWMYHADFFGAIAARKAGFRHIAWGVRNSGDSLKNSSRLTYYLARISAIASRFLPEKIIVCGEQAARIHTAWGYDQHKIKVIQNGYDLSRWQANPIAGHALRQAWGLADTIPVIGFVARWNPLKDHASLLAAFAMAKVKYPSAVCILVGKGLDVQNVALLSMLDRQGLMVGKDVLLMGMRTDIPELMSVLDIHVLSSIAEGFPNVVCESMACEVPNVVTDVGDAALIVGQYGWIAQAANPKDLAQKIIEALDFVGKPKQSMAHIQQIKHLGEQARQSVLERFSLAKMVEQYERTWAQMVEKTEIHE
ncbi:glycosyltransferase [Pelistega ratti]|uniref:glycosyltransferase n=1 Tax=Pelistega ratti TaxID=2652177 RepID=UPI001F39C705|nr:glycosyltransferase [Pelistega ratti]